MLEIFEKITTALYGNPGIAIFASFLWGIFSILLSPCHLASIPIVIAFINEQQAGSTRRAFYISATFSAGILITLIAAGVFSALIGLMLGTAEQILRIVVVVMLIVVGLFLINVLPMPDIGSNKDRRIKNRPYLSGLLLGLVFGLALGPCALAFMAPVISVVLQTVKTQPGFSILLILAYVVGHCGLIIAAGTFTELVKKYLSWKVTSKGTKIIRFLCGILLISSAIIMIINMI